MSLVLDCHVRLSSLLSIINVLVLLSWSTLNSRHRSFLVREGQQVGLLGLQLLLVLIEEFPLRRHLHRRLHRHGERCLGIVYLCLMPWHLLTVDAFIVSL